MRVLLVEDEPRLSATLSMGLKAEGFVVVSVGTGVEGLHEATENSFDVVVLDIMLPGHSGYEVLRRMRAQDVWTPTLLSGAISWIATTRWSVVKRALLRLSSESDRRAAAMLRTLAAAASSTPANNDRYRIASNPALAKVNGNNTTIADTAAERAEIPKLRGDTKPTNPLRRNGQTADIRTV